MNKLWFVLYTRSNCEKKVSELLTKREIENYCPLNKVYRQWSDRKKIVDMPLFSSYVFVRVLEKELTGLKSLTSNIVNLVYWLGKPAVVKDQEIDNIKFFLNEYSNIKLEKRNVDINEDVLIMRGPFFRGFSTQSRSLILKIAEGVWLANRNFPESNVQP